MDAATATTLQTPATSSGVFQALWGTMTPDRFEVRRPVESGIPYRRQISRGIRPLADVYLPDPTPGRVPSVVLVHGGGWVVGSRTMKPIRYLATQLCNAGFAAMAFDYRMIGRGGRLREALDDVAAAFTWWRHGPFSSRLHPGAVSIAGLSAGATLALLHAERSDEPPASVISGFGIYDFEQLRGAGASLLRRAALRTGDRDLWRRHSVADSPTFAGPVLLLHGTHDTLVPMCQHQRLVQSRQAAGLPVEERIFEGACHGFFNDAESDAAQGATREIHRFLSSLPLGRSWCA